MCKSKMALMICAGVVGVSLGLTGAEPDQAVGLKRMVEGLVSPTVLVPFEGSGGRLIVADQVGLIYIANAKGELGETPLLDLRPRLAKLNHGSFDERGVLGLALHPRFSENRRFYVYYSAPLRAGAVTNWDHTSRISAFTVSGKETPAVDLASEEVILEFDQPWFNHNGGRLAFGPDGFLYIASGDGGNANDTGRGHSPQGNGQDLSNLLGKILRLDVDGKKPYGIPRDNPFTSAGMRPEIFAYGLRNPWGISFDRGGNHELFASDVGQTMYEEVNIIVKGGNYGWRVREGTVCFDANNPKSPPAECPRTTEGGVPLRDPILEYKNVNGFPRDPEARGISVTGGYVYRGKALPHLRGRYVFADWSRNWAVPQGVLLVASRSGEGNSARWTLDSLPLVTHPQGNIGAYVVALGEDADGELYILTNASNGLVGKTGKVFKLVGM